MSNFLRKIERTKEKNELKNIKNVYNKKPKQKCPKCNRKSLYMTNDKGEVFCLRCDEKVKI